MPGSPHPPPFNPTAWTDGDIAVYHMTDVSNLEAIVEDGVVYCDNALQAHNRSHVGIAYTGLKATRAATSVRVAQGGTLADYAPFYYAPRSPMLYTIWRGNVAGANHDSIVYLVCAICDLAEEGRFVITDGHPIKQLTEQYGSLDDLNKVDWDMMREWYWRDTDQDGDRSRRRQAEFLVHDRVDVRVVRQVVAMNEETAEIARRVLSSGYEDPPPVHVRRDWYY